MDTITTASARPGGPWPPDGGPQRPGSPGDGGRPTRRPGLALLSGGVVVVTGLAVLGAVTVWTGATDPALLVDPGALTRWGLPVSRVAYDVAAVGTIGMLTAAVVLLPRVGSTLTAEASGLVRAAAWWGTAWVATALVAAALALSDAAGRPVPEVLAPGVLPLALELPQVRALVSSAWIAAVVVLFARRTSSWGGGALLLLGGGTALLPVLLTAHAGHDRVGVTSLVVHVLAATVWCGGLLALVVHLRHRRGTLAVALPRFSRVALACVVLLGLSGALTSATLLRTPADVWGTPYGRLLVAKAAALLVIALLGYAHRRRSVPAVAAGRPHAFVVLAVVELVLMSATIGLAAGLSRTAPPAPLDHGPEASTVVTSAALGADRTGHTPDAA